MRKGFLRNCIIGIAFLFTIGFISFSVGRIVSNKSATETISTVELGMKISDLKWLNRAGKISEDELMEFQNSASNVSLEEMNELLDKLLEGKDDEYLTEKAELIEKIQSALDN